jgi:S1-C subfamily serine protease/pSer/pThr/pTyr-binding forkhead associated (FHA) protein
MRLTFIQGDFAGKDVDLAESDRYMIGRADGADLRVPDTDKRASRQHAEIVRRNGNWFIRDLQSSNGVWVDGQQISQDTLLREGQTVRVGAQHFQVKQASVAEPPVPPTADTATDGAVVALPPRPDEREREEREAREREEREARERQEREARERQEREARERQEREARERQEREARERQERERKEREERERKEREDRKGRQGRLTVFGGGGRRGYTTLLRRQDQKLRIVTIIAGVAVVIALGVGAAAIAGVFNGSSDKGLDVPALVRSVQPSVVIVNSHVTPAVGKVIQYEGRDETRSSHGSGFVLNAATGEIITNGHVTDGGQIVRVALSKGKERDAKVVGENFCQDVALVRTSDTSGLKTLPTVSQSQLSEGDPVVAVGFPGTGSQDDNLVTTTGVISVVKNRQDAVYPDTVQTDAAINGGNSGGPLLNADGKVVGINTFSNVGGENQNFAISANHIAALLPELRRGISTGYTGWDFDWAEDEETALTPVVTTTDGTKYYGPQILGPVAGQTPAGQLAGIAGGRTQYLIGIDGVRFGTADNELTPLGDPNNLCQLDGFKKKSGSTMTLSVLDVDDATHSVRTFDQAIKLR